MNPSHRSADPAAAPSGRVGVWLVGACGAVGTLAVVGARAIARGLRPPVGLLTETPLLAGLDVAPVSSLVFGGHEIRDVDWVRSADEYRRKAGVLDDALLTALHDDLKAASADLRPGFLVNPSDTVRGLASKACVARAKTP